MGPWKTTRQKPIEILDTDEAHRMCTVAGSSTTGKRNAAVIAVLFGAGLRVGEAIALLPGDVDVKRARIHIRRGKGAKERSAKIVPAFVPYIVAWIEERKRLRLKRGTPLFATITNRTEGSETLQTKQGTPLKRQAIDASTRRLAKKAGIEKRCNPHSLRHSHLAIAHAAGVPLVATQAQAGHADLGTHALYISHLASKTQDEAFDALDWSPAGE